MKVNLSEITNPLFIAFLKAKGVKDGEEAKPWEFTAWIQDKHVEFRQLKGLDKGMTPKPYTEMERKEFGEFLKEEATVKKGDRDGI